MDKLMETLSGYLKEASNLVTSYAPQVWESTLALVHLTSIVHLVFGLLGLALCVLWWAKALPYGLAKAEDSCDDGWAVFNIAGSILMGLASIIDIVYWFNSTSDILGVYDPKLAILYHLASAAGLL